MQHELETDLGHTIDLTIDRPPGPVTGAVVLMHGIFSSKSENGRFDRQVKLHTAQGRLTVRFDWQGHGGSSVTSQDATVLGDVADLDAVLKYAFQEVGSPVSVVASSFGAAIFLLWRQTMPRDWVVSRSLLLNPVTDFRDSFWAPSKGELKETFTEQNWREALDGGASQLTPTFVMSKSMALELLLLNPAPGLRVVGEPICVVHGTDDASVSFDTTARNCANAPNVTLVPVEGADHAFAPDWAEKATFAIIDDWFYGRRPPEG